MILNVDPQLSQWDVDRIVVVSDTEATHMHFANPGDSKAVIMEIVGGEAQIPNYLLQTGKAVIAYAVLDGVTVGSKTFPVRKRERPENYVYDEDQRNYIYELISNAENAADRANEAADRMNYHVDDNGNPHGVTPAQIGAVSLEEYNNFVDDVTSHITSVEETVESFGQHTGDENNPHNITCEQIGAVTQKEFQEVLDNLEVPDDGDSGQLIPHITNKDNPHEVTTEQIGAVESEEYNTFVNDVINHITSVEGNLAAHSDRTDNPHGVTAAQAGAAPAGYGLGEQSSASSNWNSTTRNAFIRGNSNSPDGEWWYGLNIKYDKTITTQLAFKRVTDKSVPIIAIRHRPDYGDTTPWMPWEYVNPPMVEGVAYRTTERFNGKPVYARYLNCGALPNATSNEIFVANNISEIVRVEGNLKNTAGYLLQAPISGTSAVSLYLYSNTHLRITTATDQSTWDAYFTVYYTLAE